MQSQLITFPNTQPVIHDPLPADLLTASQYHQAEQQFIQLLETDNLDVKLAAQKVDTSQFETTVAIAIATAYENGSGEDTAHRFLQRLLYYINRLKLFWYDDLQRYKNERSLYVITARDSIEKAWQQWESAQLNLDTYHAIDVQQALQDRVAADHDPAPSEASLFFRDRMGLAGYRQLVAIASLDGLVEASQLSRTLGGVGNDVHAVLTRLLVEEYGGGRLSHKHSSYFTKMLEELEMQTQPEAYFDIVPWQVLAIINHSFLLTERKRCFLRYIGSLLYGELTIPSAFRNYQAAGKRLGLSDDAMSYWNLHIKVDELHGRWMLNDVALPLIDQYPEDAWEMVLGYDQQRQMSDRAGQAVLEAVQTADR